MMKLRFEVNQAEAFRRGINIEKSVHVIDVDPSTLDQDKRNLIADRLEGIDVCQLYVPDQLWDPDLLQHFPNVKLDAVKRFDDNDRPILVVAQEATADALIEAIQKEGISLEKQRKRPRGA